MKTSNILKILLALELLIFIGSTGRYVVITAGSLYDVHVKHKELMLGAGHKLAKTWSRSIPADASVLYTGREDPWILNYYLYPRRLYIARGVVNEAWLRRRKIEWKIAYNNSRGPGGNSLEKIGGK